METTMVVDAKEIIFNMTYGDLVDLNTLDIHDGLKELLKANSLGSQSVLDYTIENVYIDDYAKCINKLYELKILTVENIPIRKRAKSNNVEKESIKDIDSTKLKKIEIFGKVMNYLDCPLDEKFTVRNRLSIDKMWVESKAALESIMKKIHLYMVNNPITPTQLMVFIDALLNTEEEYKRVKSDTIMTRIERYLSGEYIKYGYRIVIIQGEEGHSLTLKEIN